MAHKLDYENDEDLEQISTTEMEEKLKTYAAFIDQTLYPDLRAAVAAREEIEAEIEEYETLCTHLAIQKEKNEKHDNRDASDKEDSSTHDNTNTALVDLGNKIGFCQAEFDDPRTVYVHVGMGFHTEFNLAEAISFCERRVLYLSKNALVLKQKKAKSIAAHLEAALILVEKLKNEMLENDEDVEE